MALKEKLLSWWSDRPNEKHRGPSPSDKFLPVWVIASMSIAVWLLMAQMTSAMKDICSGRTSCVVAVPSSIGSSQASQALAATPKDAADAAAIAAASAASSGATK